MKFRIEEAKKLLKDFPWKTTMAIGSEVGFSSFFHHLIWCSKKKQVYHQVNLENSENPKIFG